MTITYTPIGYVRSPNDSPEDVSHDEVDETTGQIVLEEQYADGLGGIDDFSHVVIFAHLDEVDEYRLTARPPHADDLEVGIFASRSPLRPNPIAQTTVELLDRDGTTLRVRGLDLVDGTPVLDVKPYVGSIDDDRVSLGWLEDR